LRDLALALDCAEKAHRIGRAHYGLDKQEPVKPASLTINVNTSASHAPLGQVIDAEVVSEQASEPAQLTDASQADTGQAATEQAGRPARRRKAS
jgi:sorbitol-specific phosphotransferase system component IIBC